MINEFLKITKQLNIRFNICPLLFGSLGLQERLKMDLNPDDIDVLIPEIYLNSKWDCIKSLMTDNGYILYDLHEHAFTNDEIHIAFASIESLKPFANINTSKIPLINNNGIQYLLLDLNDYLKVYNASSKDGYRKDVKNKQDLQKIQLINNRLNKNA